MDETPPCVPLHGVPFALHCFSNLSLFQAQKVCNVFAQQKTRRMEFASANKRLVVVIGEKCLSGGPRKQSHRDPGGGGLRSHSLMIPCLYLTLLGYFGPHNHLVRLARLEVTPWLDEALKLVSNPCTILALLTKPQAGETL